MIHCALCNAKPVSHRSGLGGIFCTQKCAAAYGLQKAKYGGFGSPGELAYCTTTKKWFELLEGEVCPYCDSCEHAPVKYVCPECCSDHVSFYPFLDKYECHECGHEWDDQQPAQGAEA